MSTPPTTVRALSIHADYRCQSTGVCCSSGWDIPVESGVHADLRGRLAAGLLRVRSSCGVDDLFVADERLPPGFSSRLGRDAEGRCRFLEHETGNLCAIHRQCGVEALPSECRHFPRVSVITPQSIDVSLSHFCPTAAEMLFREDCPLTIVTNPAALPSAMVASGLDAHDALPPLLRPDVLMTWKCHHEWEEHCVATIACSDWTPEEALALLAQDAEVLRRWHPGQESLDGRMGKIREGSPMGRCDIPPLGHPGSESLVARLMDCVPDHLASNVDLSGDEVSDMRWVAPHWAAWREPVGRYLAARAFASWVAQRGQGLRSGVVFLWLACHTLRRAAALVCREKEEPLNRETLTEAIRRSDLLLVHLADPVALANLCSESELWSIPKSARPEGA